MRRVTRTYWSKKKNQFVTKVYQYKSTSRRGKTLVGKTGRVNQKNIDAFKEQIRNSNANEAEKRTLIADLDALVHQRHNSKKKLTTTGFLGKMRRDAPSRFLSNAGYSTEEFAEETGLDEADILDPRNWEHGILTVDGRHFKFSFTYTGELYEEY